MPSGSAITMKPMLVGGSGSWRSKRVPPRTTRRSQLSFQCGHAFLRRAVRRRCARPDEPGSWRSCARAPAGKRSVAQNFQGLPGPRHCCAGPRGLQRVRGSHPKPPRVSVRHLVRLPGDKRMDVAQHVAPECEARRGSWVIKGDLDSACSLCELCFLGLQLQVATRLTSARVMDDLPVDIMISLAMESSSNPCSTRRGGCSSSHPENRRRTSSWRTQSPAAPQRPAPSSRTRRSGNQQVLPKCEALRWPTLRQ